MTMLPSTTEVYLYIQPIDFSKGIHTLAILVESELVMNPLVVGSFSLLTGVLGLDLSQQRPCLPLLVIMKLLKMDEKWPHG